MAKSATGETQTGLSASQAPRYHYDIYAILEGSQETYFGKEVVVNVNLVETVKVPTNNGTTDMEKCYISPTKRRGVERRTLLWAPVVENVLLSDRLGCGIPATCGKQTCPVCSVYGALQTEPKTSLVGRLTHAGGVAVQPSLPEVKQRAMHPSRITNDGSETPMPFKREYNEPGLLYPVYNHCLSITDQEFEAAAYAFLGSLSRLGAGNPKGVAIAEGKLLTESEPLLVVDRYLAPLGKRPVISSRETNPERVIDFFRAAALDVFGEHREEPIVNEAGLFTRWIGQAASRQLQQLALNFTVRVLQQVPAAVESR